MSQAVVRGFIIMVVLVAFGIVGTMTFGTIGDYLVHYGMQTLTQFGWSMPEQYDTMPGAMMGITAMHIVFRLLPLLGVACFILSLFAKTRYDSYTVPEDDYTPEEGFY
jgi:hypothetical protein